MKKYYGKYGEFEYDYCSDYSGVNGVIAIEIKKFDVIRVDVVIPDKIYDPINLIHGRLDYLPVLSIGERAFSCCRWIETVKIPRSVIFIRDYAFDRCESLWSVEIGNSVTNIGKKAFCDCETLPSIKIPNSVTTIGDCAFASCKSLRSVEIGHSIKTIGAGAFEGCESLENVKISNPDVIIDRHAFPNLESLIDPGRISIIIGNVGRDPCKIINEGYSSQTPHAKTTVSKRTQSTNSSNSMTYENFEYSCMGSGIEIKKYIGSATSVVIPSQIDNLPVTIIGEKAFYECHSLTSIKIPNSVTTIGEWAFGCCESLTSIKIPNSVTTIGNTAFGGCKSLTSIQIPNSVTTIGEGAFFACKSLTSIQIPNSVTTIGNYAFQRCISLTSVRILNPNTSIAESAFADCNSSLRILRETATGTVVETPKTTASSYEPPKEKHIEEENPISDKDTAIGCLGWSVILFIIYSIFS